MKSIRWLLTLVVAIGAVTATPKPAHAWPSCGVILGACYSINMCRQLYGSCSVEKWCGTFDNAPVTWCSYGSQV